MLTVVLAIWGWFYINFVMCVFQHEWRGMGVQQSHGWVHYAIHPPEPHVLLFRRPLQNQQQQLAQDQPAQANALHRGWHGQKRLCNDTAMSETVHKLVCFLFGLLAS